jgi:F-type H+-transporting ATPase subunit b
MAGEGTNPSVIEVPAGGAEHGHSGGTNVINVSLPMTVLTWIVFLITAWILQRWVWRPILKALDLRELGIRKALDDAEKARQEAAELETRRERLRQEADAEAQRIVSEARNAALESAGLIERRAAEEARGLVEGARREIAAAT